MVLKRVARRMNINIYDDIPDKRALELVTRVVQEGRISNDDKQYCLLIQFGKETVVTDLTRAGHDTFYVYKEKE